MNFLERQLDDPTRVSRIKRLFVVGLAAVAAAEIVLPLVFPMLAGVLNNWNLPALAALFHAEHASHFWFENFPAWGSVYGLVSCVVIIVVSKFLGKVWLMRREDYYDL